MYGENVIPKSKVVQYTGIHASTSTISNQKAKSLSGSDAYAF